jgi:hypothetical protein
MLFVQIPLNLSGLVSIEDVHFKMDGQVLNILSALLAHLSEM